MTNEQMTNDEIRLRQGRFVILSFVILSSFDIRHFPN